MPPFALQLLAATLIILAAFNGSGATQTPEEEARALQAHYNRVKSLRIEFRQVYESGPVRQEESGTLWLQKPGRMRWEYREPEFKVFVADGKNTYFYVPSNRQVMVRRLSQEDLHYTPFGFLIGRGDLVRDFQIALDSASDAAAAPLRVLHLTPRQPLENVLAMTLEYDPQSRRIAALTLQDYSGGRSRFLFTAPQENARMEDRLFRFRIPDGVEVVRLDEPEGSPNP